MPLLARPAIKQSQVVLLAAAAAGFRESAELRRPRNKVTGVLPAASGQIASGLPVTLGPGSPADGPEHGPPLSCHGQTAVSVFGVPRPAQPLPSSR